MASNGQRKKGAAHNPDTGPNGHSGRHDPQGAAKPRDDGILPPRDRLHGREARDSLQAQSAVRGHPQPQAALQKPQKRSIKTKDAYLKIQADPRTCYTAQCVAAGESVLCTRAPGYPSPQRKTGSALARRRGRSLRSSSLGKTATRYGHPQTATAGVRAGGRFSCAVQSSQGDPQTGNGRYRQNSSERTGRAGQASCPSRSQDSWDRKARWKTTVKGILGPPGPPYSRGGSQAGTNSESSKSGPV